MKSLIALISNCAASTIAEYRRPLRPHKCPGAFEPLAVVSYQENNRTWSRWTHSVAGTLPETTSSSRIVIGQRLFIRLTLNCTTRAPTRGCWSRNRAAIHRKRVFSQSEGGEKTKKKWIVFCEPNYIVTRPSLRQLPLFFSKS